MNKVNNKVKFNIKNNNISKKFYNKKFLILSSLCVIILVICLVNYNREVNIHREYEELNALYNTDEQKELFITQMDKMQSEIGRYLINNTTLDSNSFKESIDVINVSLNSDNWENLNLEKDDIFKGNYSVNEDGKLSFKFLNKDIEPSWASEVEYIILN